MNSRASNCSSSARTSRRPAPSRRGGIQRRLRAQRRAGDERRADPLLGQSRNVPVLCRRPTGNRLYRADAEDRPAGQEGRRAGLWRKVVECEPSTSSREAVFAEVVAETGAEFVHPYNDARVIAGQGTCSKELIEQVDGLDAVVAPIGGGGMVSGTCLTLSTVAPGVAIYAAEPGVGIVEKVGIFHRLDSVLPLRSRDRSPSPCSARSSASCVAIR